MIKPKLTALVTVVPKLMGAALANAKAHAQPLAERPAIVFFLSVFTQRVIMIGIKKQTTGKDDGKVSGADKQALDFSTSLTQHLFVCAALLMLRCGQFRRAGHSRLWEKPVLARFNRALRSFEAGRVEAFGG